jgi:hypothetical protein
MMLIKYTTLVSMMRLEIQLSSPCLVGRQSFPELRLLVKWRAAPLVRYSLSEKNSSSGAFELSCIACDVVLLDDPCRFEEFAVVERGWGTSRDVDGL